METKETVLTRMLDGFSSVDTRQGSVVFDLLSPAAIELALAYIEMENVLNLGFADTTYGPYLDRRAAERGLSRKPAAKATGSVTLSGPNGTIIPAATIVATEGDSPIEFATDVSVTIGIGGTVSVNVTAVNGGASGNVETGLTTRVTGSLSGIVTVTNTEPFDGGYDDETDESLLERYLSDVRTPPTSGNAAQYRKWAKEIAGVYDARVFSTWNGPGTVKVSLLASDKKAPSPTVVSAAASYIEEMRPIAVDVTVVGVDEITIDISVHLTLKAGGEQTRAVEQIRGNVTSYLADLAFNDLVVRYAKVAEAILNAADVLDYENLTINGGTGNIQVGEDDVAVLGAVTII